MNAILIARVSTEEQKEAGLSLPAQIARLEKYCNHKNLTIIKSFSFDESAYKTQRNDFDNILDFVIGHEEKVAVCFDKVDRLSRNIFDKRISMLYERALNDAIELHFVSDGQVINSSISAAEKFQFSISLGLAKYFADAISDNVKRAIEQKVRNGEWIGRAPYGYKYIDGENDTREIIIDDYAAHIVRRAFELYATGAFSMGLVSKKLKEEFGLEWTVSYVDKVFNNHFYYGQMRVNGNLYAHKYKPIITKELFNVVQKVKSSFNKKNRYKYAGQPYAYRGILRCATCNLAITPEKHKGYVYYHCTQYNGKHNAPWLREEAITDQFAQVFRKLQMPKLIADEIVRTLDEVHEHKVNFYAKHHGALLAEQKEVTKMIDNLYFDKLKGRITESAYDNFYQKLRGQETDIAARMSKLEEADETYTKTIKQVILLATRAYDLFMSSEVDEKRQLIKLVLSNSKLDGEKLVYEPHKPFDLILNCSDYQVWRPQRDSNSCSRRERAMS